MLAHVLVFHVLQEEFKDAVVTGPQRVWRRDCSPLWEDDAEAPVRFDDIDGDNDTGAREDVDREWLAGDARPPRDVGVRVGAPRDVAAAGVLQRTEPMCGECVSS